MGWKMVCGLHGRSVSSALEEWPGAPSPATSRALARGRRIFARPYDHTRLAAPSRALLALAFLAAAGCHAAGNQAGPAAPAPVAYAFQNPDLPVDARVADLLGRLTLEEKVGQMMNSAAAIPRLGIPAYDWWSEGLHGVAAAGRATVFPQAIGLAATWDTALMHRVATVISIEARAKHNETIRRNEGASAIFQGLTFWSPNVNIFRDPRWGRGQETYGEDPYLTGRMAVSFVHGMQGDDPRYLRVVSTPKHYAVHSGPDPERHRFDAVVDERDLRETYLPAFRAAVTEANAQSVMCAYNPWTARRPARNQPAAGRDPAERVALRRLRGLRLRRRGRHPRRPQDGRGQRARRRRWRCAPATTSTAAARSARWWTRSTAASFRRPRWTPRSAG